MDKLDIAIENVKQRFVDMRKALSNYDQVKQEAKKRLRAEITEREWSDLKLKMKHWLDITQELIARDLLYTGFDEDCVFGHKYIRKRLPKLHIVGRGDPPKLEKLIKDWEDLTQYLLSKGYLDKIPDVPGFELRDYIIGIQEVVEIVKEN